MSVLLRLLLCVGLILNGSAYAVASTQMQLTHMTAAIEAAALAQTSCHDGMPQDGMAANGMTHDGLSMAGMSMAGMDHESMSASADHRHHGQGQAPDAAQPDCCKSPTCTCSCLQPAPATAIAFAFGGAHIGHSLIARPMSVDHDAPALPYPIRPPIA
ncbi:CopL family metal-binding regulatory protein [Lysobacter sp. cf310]|uniref:CopL family metal-binding regulatory protein n=1 Tax=Lysobacter sp. cf310 TaxID=1761790 RepID=UPI0008ED782F|nr:CopL family metal-binding regulatory protein [Lysobacter sp. cf310]SFK92683.1 hypothetical protein SAMN04487938_2467 [Lysobacter sp. cf310]